MSDFESTPRSNAIAHFAVSFRLEISKRQDAHLRRPFVGQPILIGPRMQPGHHPEHLEIDSELL